MWLAEIGVWFCDMHATKTGDIWGLLGYGVLSAQVIFGYVLLGALITRLGILFYSDGPALNPKISANVDDFKKLSRTEILRAKAIKARPKIHDKNLDRK